MVLDPIQAVLKRGPNFLGYLWRAIFPVTPDYFSYRINFHSDGKFRGCRILSRQKQLLTAAVYWNVFKTTIFSGYYCYRALPGQCLVSNESNRSKS